MHHQFYKYFYLQLNLSRKELSFSGGNMVLQIWWDISMAEKNQQFYTEQL